ncbi:hypothetical protein [Croceicoccus mobilis]|uniref:Uncharacterized protein n=1 Tax=Croceicoccus mobilis TaxID=1703339 RepID=A0A916Z3F3_9SPHN|nr:hypothetical protein [Croceicoccus mobilis]GGD73902.1 hypothetical protein GCM10010990_24400 [Croceicoccus mobilis]
MADKTAIFNAAAVRMGTEARVTDAELDDRPLPRTLREIWDIERQGAIRDGAWNFAVMRDALAADAGVVPYPFQFAYPLPAKCLRLLEVLNDPGRASYQLEGGKILCDAAAPLYVRYLVDMPNPATWDAAFADAFAWRLAWKAGPRIVGSTFDENAAFQGWRMAVSAANRVDARENPPIEMEESEWVTARFAGYSGPVPGSYREEDYSS